MRRRLRKKLHLKEFIQYGFQFELKFKEPHSTDQTDRFFDEFFPQIEKHNLCGGGGMNPIEGGLFLMKVSSLLPNLATPYKRRYVSADQKDIDIVVQILKQLDYIYDVKISKLINANNFSLNYSDIEFFPIESL